MPVGGSAMRQTGKPMGLNCRLERDIDVGRHPIGETAEDNNGAMRNLGGVNWQ